MDDDPHNAGEKTDAIPVFGSWPRAYCAIVVAFVLQVAIFYAIGRYFS